MKLWITYSSIRGILDSILTKLYVFWKLTCFTFMSMVLLSPGLIVFLFYKCFVSVIFKIALLPLYTICFYFNITIIRPPVQPELHQFPPFMALIIFMCKKILLFWLEVSITVIIFSVLICVVLCEVNKVTKWLLSCSKLSLFQY